MDIIEEHLDAMEFIYHGLKEICFLGNPIAKGIPVVIENDEVTLFLSLFDYSDMQNISYSTCCTGRIKWRKN